MKFLPIAAFLMIICISEYSQAYKNGAPTSTCDSMFPIHGRNTKANKGKSPFAAVPVSKEISSNACLKLALKPSDTDGDDTFKGFMTMAVAESNPKKAIGRFKSTDKQSRTMDCHKHSKSAVTQSKASSKTSVKLEWCPPPTFNGNVTFLTTWLVSFNDFWVKEASTPIYVKLAPNSTATIKAAAAEEDEEDGEQDSGREESRKGKKKYGKEGRKKGDEEDSEQDSGREESRKGKKKHGKEGKKKGHSKKSKKHHHEDDD